MKSAMIAIVGRPSAGKSTLLNTITGFKVSITASVPQTTRNRIRGILNDERGQLVFIDTPGYYGSDRKFNLRMQEVVHGALGEVDMALYVNDATRSPGEEEGIVTEKLSRFPGPVLAAVNKTDIIPNLKEENLAYIRDRLPAARMLEVSALTGEGLDALKDLLFSLAPEGEPMYPPDYYTDQEPEFRAAEIIREKAIAETREEVPHALYVDIADMEAAGEEAPEGAAPRLWIRAFLVVERDSQKGILVGTGGSRIKAIRTAAQKELGKIFPYRIHLDLRVKVRPRWRRDDNLLGRLIR